MKNLLRKFIGSFFLILFLNLGFLIFGREAYLKMNILIVLIIFNIVLCLDIIIRPISSEKDQFKYPILSILLFLLLPFITILPYFEKIIFIQRFFRIWDNKFTYSSGIIMLIVGGVILIYSRLLLGKFGGSKITIEKNHQLIIRGLYNYIRHPIYLGMLMVFFGYALSFGSFILSFAFLVFFFFLFKNRMDSEEKMLKEKFGKEYEIYIEKTKHIFPYIY